MKTLRICLALVGIIMATAANGQTKTILTGNKFSALVPPLDIELFFQSRNEMTFTIKEAGGIVPNGYSETVKAKIVEVRTNLYFLSWQEKSGATVTHVEDFDNTILYSNITLDNGIFLNLVGVIKPLGTETKVTKPNVRDTLTGRKIIVEVEKKRTTLFFTADSLYISDPGQHKQVVKPKITAVYPQIFLITWQDNSKATVVQLLDLKKRRTLINYTSPEKLFSLGEGTLQFVD